MAGTVPPHPARRIRSLSGKFINAQAAAETRHGTRA